MLIQNTEMNSRQATAVAKLMEVYAEHFPGEDFHIAENRTSGTVYMLLECLQIVPFVSGDTVFFEVMDFETGDVEEFETVEEAEDHANELQRIQMEEMED